MATVIGGCALAGLAGGLQVFLIAVLLVVWSVAPFFLTTTYTLLPEGVQRQFLTPRQVQPWDRFKSYTVYPDAVFLHYARSDARSRIHKGVLLPFGPHRDEVLAIINERLPRAAEQAAS